MSHGVRSEDAVLIHVSTGIYKQKIFNSCFFLCKIFTFFSKGNRIDKSKTKHFVILIESAGRMDVVVNDFSHDSITVAIKDKKSGESSSQEYAIRYNNVDVGFFFVTVCFVTN